MPTMPTYISIIEPTDVIVCNSVSARLSAFVLYLFGSITAPLLALNIKPNSAARILLGQRICLFDEFQNVV
jgi:hypothetical protein